MFDRIHRESNEKAAAERQKSREDSLNGEGVNADEIYGDLNHIFDVAIRELHRQEERQAENFIRNRIEYATSPRQRALGEAIDGHLPQSSDRASKLGRGTATRPLATQEDNLFRLSPDDTGESDERLRIACDEHRTLIQQMLEHTTTDAEIWKILETEVFSMVKHLQTQTKREEKIKKSKWKGKIKLSHLKPPTEASQQAFASLLALKSHSLPTNTLLAILQRNYAHYNVCALRHWRRRHSSTSYALQLLPHIKSLGAISYVLGTSAGLYNEILYVKWEKFQDLHGIADLLQEMINQGIRANPLTMTFLRYIESVRSKDLEGKRGKVFDQWWNLRSVKEDWGRLTDLYRQLNEACHETDGTMVISGASSEGTSAPEEKWEDSAQALLDTAQDEDGNGRRARISRVLTDGPERAEGRRERGSPILKPSDGQKKGEGESDGLRTNMISHDKKSNTKLWVSNAPRLLAAEHT